MRALSHIRETAQSKAASVFDGVQDLWPEQIRDTLLEQIPALAIKYCKTASICSADFSVRHYEEFHGARPSKAPIFFTVSEDQVINDLSHTIDLLFKGRVSESRHALIIRVGDLVQSTANKTQLFNAFHYQDPSDFVEEPFQTLNTERLRQEPLLPKDTPRKNRIIDKPVILFPSEYSDKYVVDNSFSNEYEAAHARCDLSIALFDQRVFEEQKQVSIAHLGALSTAPVVVYRGWMMKPEDYEVFYGQLESLGAKLITSPTEYNNLHLFPNTYPYLQGVTPKALICRKENVNYDTVVDTFDNFMVKDYVKSVKGYDFPQSITSSISEEEFDALLKKFKELRGDLFTGGYIFKEYLQFKKYGNATNEWRCFYVGGKTLALNRNSGQAASVPSPPENLVFRCSSLQSAYYTVDFAELEDGSWIVVETGDGQVSGLASSQNAMLYYTLLSESLTREYPVYDMDAIRALLEEKIHAEHDRWDDNKEIFNPDLYEYYARVAEKAITGSLSVLDSQMSSLWRKAFSRFSTNEACLAIDFVHRIAHPNYPEEENLRRRKQTLVDEEEREQIKKRMAEEEELCKNDIDMSLAFRCPKEGEEPPAWIWCLVGNIVDERFSGKTKMLEEGTKHFRAGAKLYCIDAFWGMGGERYTVIGLPRKSNKLIKIVIDRKFITNFRVQKVFDKRVINSGGATWSNTDEAGVLIKRLAEAYNVEAAKIKKKLDKKMRAMAFGLASKAHEGQVDKGGNPYIEHPLAVERLVSKPKEGVVALLHDVVEDTDVTLEDLAPFGRQVVKAVDAITQRAGESRDGYLTRVEANPIARIVKIADLTHNSDLSRIPHPTQRDFNRVKKYQEEIALLSKRPTA